MNKKLGKSVKYKNHTEISDKAYFEEVYNKYFDRLFAYALLITKSEGLAKDVVSDVFYGLLKAEKDLHSIKQLKPYLFTSVKNQAIRAVSKDPLIFLSEDHEYTELSIDQVDPEELLIGKELEDFLEKTIAQLPPQCELVFRLAKQQNLNHEEVSKELNISIDTVKYHLKTALKKIKTALADHFHNEPIMRRISISILTLWLCEAIFLLF